MNNLRHPPLIWSRLGARPHVPTKVAPLIQQACPLRSSQPGRGFSFSVAFRLLRVYSTDA
jgi:hypothetical protein